MDTNILELVKKLLVNDETFDRIKEYYNSQNLPTPTVNYLNNSNAVNLLALIKTTTEAVKTNLQIPWYSIYRESPFMSKDVDVIRNFKEREDKLLISASSIPPVLSDFIFKFYLIIDDSEKETPINILKDYIFNCLEAYKQFEESPRYIDNNYKIIFDNINTQLKEKIEKRIKEVYEIYSSFEQPQQESMESILKKYNLI